MEQKLIELYGSSDSAIIEMLGKYLRDVRLLRNQTQGEVAGIAGINRSTLVQAEKGKGGTLLSFIQILRALEQLQALEVFKVKQEISPLVLAKNAMKTKRRAGRKRHPAQENDW